MSTQHTPGPWRVCRSNPSPTTGEWMIAGGIPGYLAEVRDCGSGDVAANARLIAAAPELLAALQGAHASLLWHLECGHGAVATDHKRLLDAQAAIAKATQ